MPGRSIRIAFLALAAWSILFAPGAAADDAAGERAPVDPDRVAAAIIAPTFGDESAIVARPCRGHDGAKDEGSMPVDGVPAELASTAPATATFDIGRGPSPAGSSECTPGTGPRAPPVS